MRVAYIMTDDQDDNHRIQHRCFLWRVLLIILLAGVMLLPAPATAFAGNASLAGETDSWREVFSVEDLDGLSIPELFEVVESVRQELLETRLEVVRKANEAKQRLEELIRGNRPDALSMENLRRDLDTIKEAQRVLAAILSDIINATTGNEAGGAVAAPRPTAVPPARPGAIFPSREYLESLVGLYSEKNQQLTKIVEALDGVVSVS